MKCIFDHMKMHGLELENRIFRSATWMAMANADGSITDEIVELYRSYAEGGIGAIITGMTSIAPKDMMLEGLLVFSDDSYIDGHKRITDAVHLAGSKIFMQIAIVGSVKENDYGDLQQVPIDEWTVDEIHELVGWFGDAALRAKKAGYDGVQIHAAHFFFLSRFISPLMNHRTDEYGGNSEKRARILIDVLHDIKKKAGDDFCVITKINASDGYAGGLSLQDFLTACKMLADAGIDAIEVSANGTSRTHVRAGVNEAYFKDYAIQIKEISDVPVILVGGLRSLEEMNRILNETPIEYLSMSRPFVREPNLLRRWQSGDERPSGCVSCNACYETPKHCCISRLKKK